MVDYQMVDFWGIYWRQVKYYICFYLNLYEYSREVLAHNISWVNVIIKYIPYKKEFLCNRNEYDKYSSITVQNIECF